MEFLIIIAVVVVIIAISSNNNAERKRKAKLAYLDSLNKLKKSPTNADLRQKTLELGRHYSNLMRDSKGQTVFDEVALMNDLNAACAGALVTTAPTPAGDIEERLAKLQSLKEKGLIDDSDYKQRKQELMAQI
jgi:hypothetical protein